MSRKLLFFDIDGTLINSAQEMPASAAAALRRAKAEGHILCLCTGRSYGQLTPLLLEFGFDAIVAASGAYVRVGDEVIYHEKMPQDTVLKLTDFIKARGGFYFCQNQDYVVQTYEDGERMRDHLIRIAHMSETQVRSMQEHNHYVQDIREKADDVEKMLYFDLFLPLEEIQAGVGEDIMITTNSYETAPAGSGELTLARIHKGTGMQVLMDHYQIPREDTIAFGDSGNDMEMIRFSGYGVVMGNGSEELKQEADLVTDPIWDDGLAHALIRLGLCGEEAEDAI